MYTNGYNVVTFGGKSGKYKGTIKDSKSKNAAYFASKSLLFGIKVRRSPNGPRLSPYALKKNVMYMLGCRWDDAERRKWEEFKARDGLITPELDVAPYTAEETSFLKKHYRSEYHFLRQHGLSIYKEEDREEGRMILRAIMREDEMSELGGSGDEEDDCDLSRFEGHQADYNFTER